MTDEKKTVDAKPNGSEQFVYEDVDTMLAAEDVEFKTVAAWNQPNGKPGFVRIASLTAADMIEFAESNEGPAKRTAGLRLLIKSLVNKKGDRIGRSDQLETFKKKNSRITSSIIDAILELNGLNKKAQEDAKKGSSEAHTDASPTDSPSGSVH
jgi:hypothetical protein